MTWFPFVRPYLPFKASVSEMALKHTSAMTENGVPKLLVIECTGVTKDAERAMLTVMRLLSLRSTTNYKRFSLHEVTELSLGKNPDYAGAISVFTDNLVIDMTGYESANRKAEEFNITLMELAIKKGASVTFTVAAHEDRWSKIRNFTVAKEFVTYRIGAAVDKVHPAGLQVISVTAAGGVAPVVGNIYTEDINKR